MQVEKSARQLRLGFVGTGVITEAVVTGLLATDLEIAEVHVTKRNQEVSARLAASSARVQVHASAQAVVDCSDLVFLAVRPQDARSVLSPLTFSEGQQVCSLIATLTHEVLQGWIGTHVRLFRSIPLPSVAHHRGVTVLFPHDPLGEDLFGALGTVVSAKTVEEFDAFAAASALMGTYFGVLGAAADWMQSNGIGRVDAQRYLSGVFSGLAHTMMEDRDKPYETLRVEHSTPDGLNAQLFEVFADARGPDALKTGLDSVLQRLSDARKTSGRGVQ
ncbi:MULTISPECIES: pyrroline-5-carboxylate reductase [unclassified Ruegeria]|uniref:pyrroline-5-carboxylate reductase n=1 Tax=unclassified Ruegeria TaxID=2625375 RepID=UPI001489139D|nr:MULTISPECIES: pyrroline-5-carboxylate reductase [unclassified Ruegeria]NOD77555.1 NAD(P)-binding domain-containing protein [Ruegeria sp. HKCCD4332]NOD89760.1 NAD(P)-binding domain-containing protein [Ruegeria sp. HKCCD4318]NOE14794.1 NAD(P)-binding domain-containing protein [Ruegeria sp. HKCCD4318-2]NOG11604.1 NAD(P)-binding domain-containing protein [Ruegeria sp. HKCCD4315]